MNIQLMLFRLYFDPRTRVECGLLTEVAIVVLCNISIRARSVTCDYFVDKVTH